MLANQVTVWVFVNGTTRPFPITMNGHGTIGGLQQAIRAQEPRTSKHAAADLLLYHLCKPVLIVPVATLSQRIKNEGDIEHFAVLLGEPTMKLQDVFLHKADDANLHVIVELPHDDGDERAHKKSRAVGPDLSNDDLAEWNNLWLTFWGKPASECFVEKSVRIPDERTLVEDDDETKYQCLTLPNDGAFPCGLRQILITKTYRTIHDELCEQEKLHANHGERLLSRLHSTVITGQPGTGKTAGLSCILVWRLQQKKPTVYCHDTSYAYVFTDSGFQRVTLGMGSRIAALDSSVDCCGLVDINVNLTNVPPQFRPSQKRLGRVVVATSPNPDHVNAFKQHHATTYYTPTWEWVDLYCGSLLLHLPHNVKLLRDMYTKLRGIRCYRALTQADGELAETLEIRDAVNQIKDIAELAHSASGSMPFKLSVSHALVRIEPDNSEWNFQVTDLLSNYVAELVYDRIRLYNSIQVKESIEHLLRIPPTRCWGSKLFEIGVHRVFRKGATFEPVAMNTNAPPLCLQIKKAESEADGYFHTLSVGADHGSRKVDEDILNQYLISLSSTAETIDAVYISESVTVFMQITVAPTHNLDYRGIKELIKELPAVASKMICILFVVPEHEYIPSGKQYMRQKIVFPYGLPPAEVDKVNGYNQYVHYFPVGQLSTD